MLSQKVGEMLDAIANDFLCILKRGNTLRVFDLSLKTHDVARILSSQPVSAMGCYTGTIFNATSLQIVSLKIDQCDITLKVRHFISLNLIPFCSYKILSLR